jgi:hypothetical protein
VDACRVAAPTLSSSSSSCQPRASTCRAGLALEGTQYHTRQGCTGRVVVYSRHGWKAAVHNRAVAHLADHGLRCMCMSAWQGWVIVCLDVCSGLFFVGLCSGHVVLLFHVQACTAGGVWGWHGGAMAAAAPRSVSAASAVPAPAQCMHKAELAAHRDGDGLVAAAQGQRAVRNVTVWPHGCLACLWPEGCLVAASAYNAAACAGMGRGGGQTTQVGIARVAHGQAHVGSAPSSAGSCCT